MSSRISRLLELPDGLEQGDPLRAPLGAAGAQMTAGALGARQMLAETGGRIVSRRAVARKPSWRLRRAEATCRSTRHLAFCFIVAPFRMADACSLASFASRKCNRDLMAIFASKVPTDITEDVIRQIALPPDRAPLGFVDMKVCAVDAVWSGLRLVVRKELRPSSPG